MSMSPFEKVQHAARGWKRTGEGRGMFCCDAHKDKRPSVSVKELPDGTVLMHCFAGCEVDHVLMAMGLDLSDLFPERDQPHHTPAPSRRGLLSAREALSILDFEALLTATAAQNLAQGVTLTAQDLHRLSIASQRISAIRQEAYA